MFSERLFIKQMKYPLDDQADWLNNPRNNQFSEQRHRIHDKNSCAEYIRSCSVFWGIQEVDSGEWIGTMSAHIDEHNNIADLGILIHYEYHRKGYGAEAWKTALDHLLKSVRKVEAGCMSTNLGMIATFKKTGMFFEGERGKHFITGASLVMYGKTAQ